MAVRLPLLGRLPRRRVLALASLGVVMAAVGIIMACYGFPKIMDAEIRKRIVLREGTEGFKMWKDTPFPLSFKVYIFNVTNPEAVTSGARPELQEVGPYFYDQYRRKENVSFEENDRISYNLRKTFYFNETKSKGLKETDKITVLNVGMLGLILTVNKILPTMLLQVDPILTELFGNSSDPFLRTSVRDFLFQGVYINCTSHDVMIGVVCRSMRSRLPPTIRPTTRPGPGYLFSMFHHMNSSAEGPYEIESGARDVRALGRISRYRGAARLPAWPEDSPCSALNGTDSTIFPPIDEAAVPPALHIFQPDVCRTMYAEYQGRRHSMGLPALRYEAGRAVLQSGQTNADNECYCLDDWSVDGMGCLLDGVQSLRECQADTPVVASFPHFYLGSRLLVEYAAGIRPNKEKHQTFIDIEPKTGAAIRGAKRLQFNMELARLEDISLLAAVSPGLFPVLWLEEGGELNDDIKEMLNSVYRKIKIIKVLQWMLVGVGGVLVLSAWGWRGRGRLPSGDPNERPPQPRPLAAPAWKEVKDGFSNRVFSIDESVAHK